MRILVTGSSGQLGWELQRSLACRGTVLAPPRTQFDLSQPDTLHRWLDAERPDILINPAAFTAVDKAETETALAMAINRDAPAALAQWCARHGAPLVHYSTDYVFDGTGVEAFGEGDPTGPVNAYGRSKLAGELAIGTSGCEHLILRTSWVYAARGNNFLNTMLRVAQNRDELRVVDDQIGAPTPARLLADVTAALLGPTGKPDRSARALSGLQGVFHLTAAGSTSWHGFACAIMDLRSEMLGLPAPRIQAIPSEQYPTPAPRPRNSRLDTTRLSAATGLQLPDWQSCLRWVMGDRFAQS